ncbi:MAG: UDP-N-acetylmuramoyl-tripeptide--D-alanyl-D-alanine ligase, partial [Alistipes sp.]|nr:UDP-N-acetylmuramoyl-tripeptide--D-alanyl-D-alanine ligase [Alistipes sp.]
MSALYEKYLDHPFISTDTRRIRPDSLFFALRGASFDGNRFAEEALAKGAAYAVVDDASVVQDERYILVEDTLSALQALAREHRRALGIPILAVAGSNGKTTTKELVSRVLAQKFRLYATQGNLNNHIGVPLTLLAMDRTIEFGVVEMGASAQGEIAALCAIAEPNFGILTNVGRAHLEGFGGVEGVRKGKGELFDYLNNTKATSFVREEDLVICSMAEERSSLRVNYYSEQLAEGIPS